MSEPSPYGLQTQSTAAGDHCFSGLISSTVPLLAGTPGFLPPRGMMGQPMSGLQTQSMNESFRHYYIHRKDYLMRFKKNSVEPF